MKHKNMNSRKRILIIISQVIRWR